MTTGHFLSQAKKFAQQEFKRRLASLKNRSLGEGLRYFFGVAVALIGLAWAATQGASAFFTYFVVVFDKEGRKIDASLEVSWFFSLVFIVGWFFLLFLLLAIARIASENQRRNKKLISILRSSVSRKRTYLRKLRDAYDFVGKEAERVFELVNGNPPGIRHDYGKIHTKYIVARNGDTIVEKEIVIRAPRTSVINWEFYIDATPYAENQLLYKDIGFTVTALDEHQCAFTPMRDGLLRKSLLISFLPYMKHNEQRRLLIKYRWPGYFSRLFTHGEDEIYWDNSGYTKSASTDFRSEFVFPSDVGEISAKNAGAYPPDLTITTGKRDSNSVITLECVRMPVGKYRLSLKKAGTTAP